MSGAYKSIRMKQFIEIGYIVKAHGIRGEICIEYNADSPDLLWDSLYLAPASARGADKGSGLTRYGLVKMRMHQGRPLLTLEGVPDRTTAELLRQQRIFIPESRLPEPGDHEIYMTDLPGLEVLVLAEDGSKTHLGALSKAEEQAGQEIWTITTPDGKEVLFPATEEFVASINLDSGEVLITPPPGLLDIYLDEPKKDPSEAAAKKARRERGHRQRTRQRHKVAKGEMPKPGHPCSDHGSAHSQGSNIGSVSGHTSGIGFGSASGSGNKN